MEAIHYKGWIIIEETDPWAIKYGFKYIFFPEGEEEFFQSSPTIDEAKDEITETVFTRQYTDWNVRHSTTLQPASFTWLHDAISFAVKFNAVQFDHFNAP